MQNWWFAAAAVGAAAAFGTSTHLKHLSASGVPDAQTLHPTALGRFIRVTLAHRLWLGGIGADVVGLSLQLLALHLGPLATVQPLLVLGLLFALLLRQGHHRQLRLDELGWVLLVTASLAGFLVLSGTASSSHTTETDHGPAIGAAVTGFVLATVCVLLGRQHRGRGRAAALLGVTVGVFYATTAALLKALTNIVVADPISILWSWQLYTVLVLGAAGLLLNQLAFQAGPLAASLPATATIDPLLSVVIGVWVFDEHFRHGVGADPALAVLLLSLGIGVIQLARTCARDQPSEQPQRLAPVLAGADTRPRSRGTANQRPRREDRMAAVAGQET
ncbi:MAG TPA: DMT family transporter [Jatrophihabitans sp.]|jgi:hypothetical protein|nr:DMT family transporter [Jatrophihabitans sp.]